MEAEQLFNFKRNNGNPNIMEQKIVVITSESLQQFIQSVAIKFEVISCATKNFIAINFKYFNDNFNVIIYLFLQ